MTLCFPSLPVSILPWLSRRYGIKFTYRPAHHVVDALIRECGFCRFSPRYTSPSITECLLVLGQLFGHGLHLFHFRQVLRECIACQNFVFADRRTKHRCDGPVLPTQAADFDVVSALLTMTPTAGLTCLDLFQLFALCDTCRRVFLERNVGLHACLGTPF